MEKGLGKSGTSEKKRCSSSTYGFNGMEKDDEVAGEGNSYTTHFRQNDVRIGRWFSVDPEAQAFPWQSPYISMDNNPIVFIDLLGDSTTYIHGGEVIHITHDELENGIVDVTDIEAFNETLAHQCGAEDLRKHGTLYLLSGIEELWSDIEADGHTAEFGRSLYAWTGPDGQHTVETGLVSGKGHPGYMKPDNYPSKADDYPGAGTKIGQIHAHDGQQSVYKESNDDFNNKSASNHSNPLSREYYNIAMDGRYLHFYGAVIYQRNSFLRAKSGIHLPRKYLFDERIIGQTKQLTPKLWQQKQHGSQNKSVEENLGFE